MHSPRTKPPHLNLVTWKIKLEMQLLKNAVCFNLTKGKRERKKERKKQSLEFCQVSIFFFHWKIFIIT